MRGILAICGLGSLPFIFIFVLAMLFDPQYKVDFTFPEPKPIVSDTTKVTSAPVVMPTLPPSGTPTQAVARPETSEQNPIEAGHLAVVNADQVYVRDTQRADTYGMQQWPIAKDTQVRVLEAFTWKTDSGKIDGAYKIAYTTSQSGGMEVIAYIWPPYLTELP